MEMLDRIFYVCAAVVIFFLASLAMTTHSNSQTCELATQENMIKRGEMLMRGQAPTYDSDDTTTFIVRLIEVSGTDLSSALELDYDASALFSGPVRSVLILFNEGCYTGNFVSMANVHAAEVMDIMEGRES